MAEKPGDLVVPQEFRKRVLSVDIPCLDDASCMKCDEDCPDARSLQCGHLFCLECITDEVKHAPSLEVISCPICRSITTMPEGGWDKLSSELPNRVDVHNVDYTLDNDEVDYDYNSGNGNDDNDDNLHNKDVNTVIDGTEDVEGEVDEERDICNAENFDEETEYYSIKEQEDDITADAESSFNESKEIQHGNSNSTTDVKDPNHNEKRGSAQAVKLCHRHQQPFLKNRCKTCRTIETRIRKMDKMVGNKVQLCDLFFQQINSLQTSIHTGMNRVKVEIQERSRLLVAEIKDLEQQELQRLEKCREQRIEKLRECGQTLMEAAKGIRDELAIVQDKVDGTQDSEFNDSMKDLRKACQKKILQPDQKLKLLAFTAGKDDKLSEIFGKIDEKPKD